MEIFFNILMVLSTIISPLLVAYFVYDKWHEQKGSEVIANEAKDLILKIIEVEKLNNSISNFIAFKNNDEEKDHIKAIIKEFKEKTDNLHQYFDFIVEVIHEKEDIKGLLDKYLEQSTLSIVRYNALLEANNPQDSIKKVALGLQHVYINMGNSIKSKLIDYVLYKKKN